MSGGRNTTCTTKLVEEIFNWNGMVVWCHQPGFVALSLVAWAFDSFFRVESTTGSLLVKTKELPTSAWFPDIVDRRLNGMFFIAVLVLVLFYVLGV